MKTKRWKSLNTTAAVNFDKKIKQVGISIDVLLILMKILQKDFYTHILTIYITLVDCKSDFGS